MSHLKEGSIKVKKGDEVKKGDIIGNCGNSGRSPYPHLHFQVQQTPYVGSKTLNYPLSSYLIKQDNQLNFNFFDFPKENSTIKSVDTQNLMSAAFHFVPGRKLSFKVDDGTKEENVSWEVKNDMYNNTYLYCTQSKAKAYFVNDGILHYFTLFEGNRDSLLYYFYMGTYKVLLGYYQQMKVHEQYPLYLMAPSSLRYLHDFTAPFFQYMNAQYTMKYMSIDDDLSPSKIVLKSTATLSLFNKVKKEIFFDFTIKNSRFYSIEIIAGNKKILARCVE